MATQEYLLRYIESNKTYEELPSRLKLAISGEEWARKVKSYCIHRGFSWAGGPASRVLSEREYYEALIAFYRTHKRLFPYHLGEYVCRILRVTPFKYYRDVLADSMREDNAYDAIPNFTAADAVRVVGIGRNEYISVMQQAKSKKLLWRMNKGIVKDLLPEEPRPPAPEPWWTLHLVNLGEVEYRSLTKPEVDVCQMAAEHGGARCSDVDPLVLEDLYRKGLVWLEVPIAPGDHLSIPPLEGFVSNRTAAPGAEVDPLETLMYQLFVAASDRVTVAQLASILHVDVDTLEVSISVACRLKFCRKLPQSPDRDALHGLFTEDAANVPIYSKFEASGAPAAQLQRNTPARHQESLVGTPSGPDDGSGSARTGATPEPDPLRGESLRGVALVVDSEVTGYLMMGALTPAVKKHSVTLFEGGRVYGSDVIDELVNELKSSVKMAAEFEGEMASLAATAASLAIVIECVRACAGGRPIEMLRKESVENLTPAAAFRILSHSYSVVLPVAGMPYPPLPLSLIRHGPSNYGALPGATTPWMQLVLYRATRGAPVSLVLPLGRRISQLPPQLDGCSSALVWPWNAQAIRAKSTEAVVLPAPAMLHSLNAMLRKTALLVQPLRGNLYSGSPSAPSNQKGCSGATENSGGAAQMIMAVGEENLSVLKQRFARIVDVPLPLPCSHFEQYHSQGQSTTTGESTGAASHIQHLSSDLVSLSPSSGRAVKAIDAVDGGVEEVELPPGCAPSLLSLGLACAVGSLRLLRDTGSNAWVPLHVSFGVPLHPRELCEAVCESAMAAQFLDPDVCQRHTCGQRTLQATLQQFISRYGTRIAYGEGDDDLAVDVALPVHPLEVDVEGRTLHAELPGVLQGLEFSRGAPLMDTALN